MTRPSPKEKLTFISAEVPRELSHQVHLAAAMLSQSKSAFIRDAITEKLGKMNLPKMEDVNEQTP